ncbi:MAG: EF-P lysine aminoacylase GenX [Candidatus Marinimicrobia bacterium]|nr:EF-P lysine aminoacylase GenX [Candidatus Neomarinimicrobiota bacterium]MCF7840596.1 EF-P lysine aminoacylase GenX [Candidatus Neomarinimicrobiota bacterium]
MNRFQRLRQKRDFINLIRQFFTEAGFFEIETPLLVPSPGMEVFLQGFSTEYANQVGDRHKLYLPTSPEFAIKKALSFPEFAGENLFEIARVFRNSGENSKQHHPEFNMLEWYRVNADYTHIMTDCENLLVFLATAFPHTEPGFDWSPPYQRSSIVELFKIHTAIDLTRALDDDVYLRREAELVMNQTLADDDTFEDIFFRLWLDFIEPILGQDKPQIVYDYPASMAALARRKPDDPRWAERFEIYARGYELGNAFSELTDPDELLERFQHNNALRRQYGYAPHPIDHALIEASGKMPPTGGIAVGVERLLQAMTGAEDLREFFLLPLPE